MQIAKSLITPAHLQKAEVEQIARRAAKSTASFKQLLDLMHSEQVALANRAAWCFSLAAKLRPEWTRACQSAILEILDKPDLSDGLLRNTLRILRDTELAASSFDRLAYHCFNFVEDPKQAIAIRAFSMHILGEIGCHIAEIRPEVKAIIEYHFANGAAGLRSSGRAVLRLWEKQGQLE